MQSSANKVKPKCTGLVGAVLAAGAVLSGCGASSTPPQDGRSALLASVMPATGHGSNQMFTVTFSDPKGVGHLKSARVLINDLLDGRKACYVYYYRAENAFLLVKDSGEGSTQMNVGSAESIGNSQCRLNGSGSSVSAKGNDLTIRLNLTFDPGVSGQKQIFLASEDTDGHTTELRSYGSWTVP